MCKPPPAPFQDDGKGRCALGETKAQKNRRKQKARRSRRACQSACYRDDDENEIQLAKARSLGLTEVISYLAGHLLKALNEAQGKEVAADRFQEMHLIRTPTKPSELIAPKDGRQTEIDRA